LGQRVAKAMKIEPLSRQDLSDIKPMGFDRNTPLWFYVWKEAELRVEGRTLGLEGEDQDFKRAALLRFAEVA
jgi:hypothetical protein